MRGDVVMILNNEKGSSIIIIAFALVALVGIASIAVDLGLGFSIKIKLQNTADAAALAGAQELPFDIEQANIVALNYIQKNGFDPDQASITISEDHIAISVVLQQDIFYTFARVLGFSHNIAKANSKAINAPISSMRGVKPLAVESFPFIVNEEYILKVGAVDNHKGNFGAISLGGSGALNYENNLIHGYPEIVRVGDYVTTEPGNMTNATLNGVTYLIESCKHIPACTSANYVKDCPRVIHIPLVETLNLNGKEDTLVVGFAAFLLEGLQNEGGHMEVVGRFIREIFPGEIGITQKDYGIRGVKLVY